MENENQVVKQKSNKGLIVSLIILLIMVLGLCSYIVYDKYFMKEETKTNEVKETQTNVKEESKNDNTTIEVKKEEVPITDLYAFCYDNTDIKSVFYGYIQDGYLYYINDSFSNVTNKKASTYTTNIEGIKKYEKLSNIKRIKVLNKDGQYPTIYLITEDGKVYYREALFDGDFSLCPPFDNYKIDNILSETKINEQKSSYQVILQDGTTTTVSW